METRIVVTDGHTLVREGVCELLEKENDLSVVAKADNSSDTVRYCNGHRPDVVLIDPDSSGSSNHIFGAIRESSPNSAIIVMSGTDNPRVTQEAFRCGVDGYVLKGEDPEALIEAVRKVREGQQYVNPRIAIKIAQIDNEDSGLTDREKGILRLIAYGHTNGQIAQHLFLSIRTVESHRAHISQKLDASNRCDLVKAAIELGLMEISS